MAKPPPPKNDISIPPEPEKWESFYYQLACKTAQEEAIAYLQKLDDKLLAHKPAGWQVVGKRQRTFVTIFGEFCIERRLYQDENGEMHFLLDEYLKAQAWQADSTMRRKKGRNCEQPKNRVK